METNTAQIRLNKINGFVIKDYDNDKIIYSNGTEEIVVQFIFKGDEDYFEFVCKDGLPKKTLKKFAKKFTKRFFKYLDQELAKMYEDGEDDGNDGNDGN